MVVVAGRRCGLRHVGGMVAQGACRGAIRARGGAKGAWEGGRQPVGPHPFDSTRKTCPQRCASPRRARTHRCLLTAAAAGGGGRWYIGGVGRDAGPVWDDSDVPPLRRLDLGLGDAGPWMGGRDGDMTDEVEDPPGRP